MNIRRLVGAATSVVAVFLAGCGGGGGGGSGAGSSSSTFILTDVKYGRKVDDGSGERLVSPLTTATIDPITGLLVPGTLQPLAPGVDVAATQTLGLGTDYLPRVVPRNCVLQLEFTAAIDPASVTADVVDASGNLVSAGSVQVRTQDDKPIPVNVTLHGPSTIWIDPVTPGHVGFPPSPVDFGPAGEPRADATGFLKLRLPRSNGPVLRSTGDSFLGSRADHLGDVTTPIGINPGNVVLDFIAQNQLIPSNETFNGFLPDISDPRIVRTHRLDLTLNFGAGDSAGSSFVDFVNSSFSTIARKGLGEWAGARMTLRPGAGNEEVHTISGNTRTRITILDAFSSLPQDGDVVRLERSEFFEPDLTDPIDPAHFDADDPENPNNTQLINFVEVFELDAQGNAVAGPTSLRQSVPAFSELRIRFTEPMAAESLRPWETFKVTYVPDTQDVLSDVTLDSTQEVAIIRPARLDQVANAIEIVGWGKGNKALQLTLTTVPKPSYLQQRMSSDEVASFLDQGVRSITDLGGQPLAFSNSQFTTASPPVRYSTAFASAESASTQVPPPVVRSWGVMVHRMQGRPITGIDPATGEPGVNFRDQVNYYRPIGDVNLQTNGYLAGAPVVYTTKVHDDFFPPPHGQFGKFPLGVPAPLSTASTANQPHDGARFQCVWRDIDASPSRDALAGTLLDLYRVSWAPIGGNVTSDTYENISLHCAHSPLRPITTQNQASAQDPFSGLAQPYDFDAWLSVADSSVADKCPLPCFWNTGPNYWDTLVTCVQPGTKYKISQSDLFAPPFDGNAYCPWPKFDVNFQYNNGDIPKEEKDLRLSLNSVICSTTGVAAWQEKRIFSSDPDLDNLGGDSLLFEVRIRPQQTLVSRANGFTMAIGVLLDQWPNFRVFSLGSTGATIDPDNINGDQNARCALDKGGGGLPKYGDNSRYFTTLDYVKTTSRIISPFLRVIPNNTTDADYFPVILFPPPSQLPAGTTALFEFAGANGVAGGGTTGFNVDINLADRKPNLAFRATLVGNTTSLLLPTFDTVAIPYLRPSGP
jgi:hypothetical protein